MPRTSHRFMYRMLLCQMALAILLALPLAAKAQDFHWNEHNPYPDYDGQIGQGRIVQQPINRALSHGQILSLEQELRLGYSTEIISLSITAQSITRQGGSLQLLEDGRPSGSPIYLSSVPSPIPVLLPLGRQGRLEIQVLGNVFVQEIMAEVQDSYQPDPNPYPNPGPIPQPGPIGRESVRLQLFQRVYGSAQLPLLQLAQRQGERLHGRLLQRVVVEGYSQGYSRAQARLVINGIPGQYKLLDQQRTPFPLDRELGGRLEIGRDIRSIQLEVLGDAQIDTIMLKLDEGGYGPGPGPIPGPSRDLRMSPMRDLNGRLSQTLMQALSLPSQFSERLVSSITLEVSSINAGGLALVDIGRGPLQRATVDRYTRPVTVILPQPVPLRDIGINTTGHVRVETLTVQFVR